MFPVPFVASLSLLLLTACSGDDDRISPRRTPAALPADAVYGGEFVLRGEPSLFAGGSATIAIAPRGEDALVLARSWDLGDPAWRSGADSVRLYFALDVRDVWPGATGTIAPEMDLVARFDPDGNPATEERGVARVRLPVHTGARDIAVELAIGPQVAVSAEPAGG